LLVAREECVARSKAMHADSRLPPILVGEGGAKRRNEEGYRAFRAERSELWSELAGLLQAAFAELLGLEVALRPAKRPDDTVVFTYSHVWPQSWDAAGALVHEWAPSSERAAASAARPRPDASDKIAAGRATLAAVEGVEAGLKALATESADAEARGGAFAWEDWRARLEPLLAAANEHRAIDARRVLSDWDDFRSLHLARAYTRDPVGHGLPAPTLAYFVDRWRREAQIRVAGMGGTSQGYTDLVEPEDDRTQLLLELPENRLFGWSWGDDNTLVVAVARDALQRAELGGVVTGVTNGSR